MIATGEISWASQGLRFVIYKVALDTANSPIVGHLLSR